MTVRVDHRVQGWGHACNIRKIDDGDSETPPLYRGSYFGQSIKIGDEIILRQQSGRDAIYILTKVDPCRDPSDMYFIECYPDHYLDEEK